MSTAFILEWSAALLTICGAWLLSSGSKRAQWGWVLFLAANGVWIAFAWQQDLRGLLVQQAVLTLTSLRGILNSPWVDDAFTIEPIDPFIGDLTRMKNFETSSHLPAAEAGLVHEMAEQLTARAASVGLVVTIERRPLTPLAMGHAEYVIETYPLRGGK